MIRTVMFLQKSSASLSSMRSLFSYNARYQINAIVSQFDNVKTACELMVAIQKLFAN
jgi:hypothetical protein